MLVKDHYGPEVVNWIQSVLNGEQVRPLCLIGPQESGKTALHNALGGYVNVEYWRATTSCWRDSMLADARVVVLEDEKQFPAELELNRWLTIHRQMEWPIKIPNRLAWLSCQNDDRCVFPVECEPIIAHLKQIEKPIKRFNVIQALIAEGALSVK